MKPINVGDRLPKAVSCYQLSTRIRLQLIEFLVKAVPSEFPNTQGVDETISCCTQTDSKAPLLKITLTQLIEHGESELVPTQKLHPYILVPLVQKVTLQATKAESKHPLRHKPFVPQWSPPCKIC